MSHLFNRNFTAQETPFSQLSQGLSQVEQSGGMLNPGRRHQVPRDWPSPVTRFLAPPSPKPSARRPAPRPMTTA